MKISSLGAASWSRNATIKVQRSEPSLPESTNYFTASTPKFHVAPPMESPFPEAPPIFKALDAFRTSCGDVDLVRVTSLLRQSGINYTYRVARCVATQRAITTWYLCEIDDSDMEGSFPDTSVVGKEGSSSLQWRPPNPQVLALVHIKRWPDIQHYLCHLATFIITPLHISYTRNCLFKRNQLPY